MPDVDASMAMAKHAQRMATRAGCTGDEIARALRMERSEVDRLLGIAGGRRGRVKVRECGACGGSAEVRRGKFGTISFRVLEPGMSDQDGEPWRGGPMMQVIARFEDSIAGSQAVCAAVPLECCPFCGRVLRKG
ncbi:MAG: hypothetical protein Q4B30_07905 [Coriobacteriaceae bacterium]|nr:hypothetical protein [Coriobacteriaceae bacterium]